MPVVTIDGHVGSGGIEVGTLVAHHLNADYLDRQIFVEAAKRAGSTVKVLAEKEQRVLRLRDHIGRFLQTMLERSAMSGAGGDPYFGPDMYTILSEKYTDLADEPITEARQLSDKKFIEVTSAVIKDLADQGNVVILGRGANMILQDRPDVFNVGLTTPVELRTRTIMEREHLESDEAEKFATEMEKARVVYFRKFFKVHPDDPTLYHLFLNMERMTVKSAAEIISHAAVDFLD